MGHRATGTMAMKAWAVFRPGAVGRALLAALVWGAAAGALTPPPGTPIVNTAVVDFRDASGYALPRVSATVQTPVSAGAVLKVFKEESSDPAAMGALLTYTIHYENTGNAPATGVVLTDHLSEHVVFQSASAAGVYAPGPPGGGTVTWAIGTLASGQTGSVTLTVRVKTPADYAPGDPGVIQMGSIIGNVYALTSAEASAGGSVTTTVGVSPNLRISKAQAPTVVGPGGTITYTLTYRNAGNAPAGNVQIQDQLPEGTAYVPGSAMPGGVLDDRTLTWSIGAVPAGAEGTVSFQVTVSPLAVEGQQIGNIAMLVSPIGIVESNAVSAVVSQQGALSLSKSAAPDPVRAGTTILYTIGAENTGLIALTGFVLRDALPENTVFEEADGSGVLAGGTVLWNIGTLAVGETRVLHLKVRVSPSVPTGTVISNTVTAEATQLGTVHSSANVSVVGRTAGTVEFLDSEGNPTGLYHATYLQAGGLIYVRVADADQNTDSTRAETVLVMVVDETTQERGTLILTETGIDTGVFVGGFAKPEWGVPDKLLTAHYADPVDGTSAVPAQVLIDPFGVVFDSVSGAPVSGATVVLCYPGTTMPVNPADLPPGQPSQVITGADGRFEFPLVPPGSYCFNVLAPAGSGYTYPSGIPDASLPPGYVIGIGSRGETFTLVAGMPPLNLDIPLDPAAGELTVTKTAGRTAVSIGDLVRYTVTISNPGPVPVADVQIVDALPRGIEYLPGSSAVNGAAVPDPSFQPGRTLVWTVASVPSGASLTLTYTAAVGVDAVRGDARNVVLARGTSAGRSVVSLPASVTLKISEGVFTSRGTLIGRVFQDVNLDGIPQDDEPGVADVVLFLEDGTRVVTDAGGKYSIPGLRAGTHVVRLDETTLPKGLRPRSGSNRFLGNSSSQIVDMVPGGLMKANFAVVRTDQPASLIKTVQAASYPKSRLKDAVSDARNLEKAGFENIRVELLGDSYALRIGVANDSADLAVTQEKIRKMFPTAVIRNAYYIEERIVHPEKGTAQSSGLTGAGDSTVSAVSGGETGRTTAPVGTPGTPASLEDQIRTMTPDLAFLGYKDGQVVSRDSIRLLVKSPLSANPELSLNGRPVGKERIGTRVENRQGNVALTEYVGVQLVPGEKNTLRAEVRDDFGNVRAGAEISLVCAGRPVQVAVRTSVKEIPADGVSTLTVEAWVMDKNGNALAYPKFLTVETSTGEVLEPDADSATEGVQVSCEDGVARFRVRSPHTPGEGKIRVTYDRLEGTAAVFFAPHLRRFLLTGIGEITFGHGDRRGDVGFSHRNEWMDDGWYGAGRGAFFLKGGVGKDFLLTAAYDSDKKTTSDFFGERRLSVESGELYPIYGDESRFDFEAASREKIYVRVDKGRSYLMYGDIQTDISDVLLSAVTRTLTGMKTEVRTERLDLKAFASRTDQTQVVDTLAGRWISGYYYLSRAPVVEGSESVVIETRDRRQTERVLKREARTRGMDYFMDYDLGTILFKEPVPSRDIELNPVFIIVSYETAGGRRHYVYGGRAVLKPLKWMDIGFVGVTEENEVSDYRLAGADVTVRLPGKTTLRAEWAETVSLFDDGGVLTPRRDQGWMAQLESRPTDRLTLRAQYRDVGTWFGNLSAVDAARGMRKAALEGSYRLTDTLSLRAGALQEKDVLNAMEHERASVGLEKKSERTSLLVEVYHETARGDYVPPADPNSRFPFDIRRDIPERSTAVRFRVERKVSADVSLLLDHRQNILSTEDVITQAGLSWRLDPGRRLYVRQEYGQYAGRTETRTAMGVEADIFRNTVAFEEYRLSDGADGRRNQQSIGLRNRFLLAPNVTGNISIENLTTLTGDKREDSPDAFAAAGGIEYLPRDNVKLTGRLEFRNETGTRSWLEEVGLAYRFNPDYSFLVRERFFRDDPASGLRVTTSTLVGLAYRPVSHDRFNGLARLEFKKDRDTTAAAGYDSSSYITSMEGLYQADRKTQVIGKYAGKFASDYGTTSYTDLLSGRILRDLTDRLDIAAECRLLTTHKTHSRFIGGSVEFGYRAIRNLWISLGYSFDDFDTDLTGAGYRGEGPFIRIRLKLDEGLLRK